jgi:Fe2+ or Zn2+ uptake regulation protein
MAPSGVRPAEIRKALQDNGAAISFASIHHALRQLEARNAAEQVGDRNSWRYHEA